MAGKIQTFILKDEVLKFNGVGGKKKIFVYTPKSFTYERAKSYPLIYCFDGQNIFETSKDFICESKVSLSMEKICQTKGVEAIIVGIYNGEGESTRDRELTMSPNFGLIDNPFVGDTYKCGTLEKTGEFIKKTLISFMEEKFNAGSDRNKTILSGASSGGLASLYLGLCYPDIFGRLSVLSPATSLFGKTDWKRFLSGINKDNRQKIFIYCGKNCNDDLENFLYDGGNDLLGAKDIKSLLNKYLPLADVKEVFIDGAIHNESAWKTALFNSFDFLFDFDKRSEF